MKKYIILCFLIVLLSFTAKAQLQKRYMRIMEYNVENLFDTINNPIKLDDDFLPEGKYKWTQKRYVAKLHKLARVILVAQKQRPIDIILMCEVESDTAMTDLIRRTPLSRLGYKYIITHCADKRGINVAMLYQPATFKPIQTETFRIPFKEKKERPTRDILHVAGLTIIGDTLDIFGVHMPSRRGGAAKTDPYRIRANKLLRQKVDSIMLKRATPNIFITGDFNDGYDNRSLRDGLNVLLPTKSPKANELYILTAHPKAKHGIRGTFKWRGEWNELDQMVVNGEMLTPRNSWHTSPKKCHIFTHPLIMKRDKRNGMTPYRTYRGPVYIGGYSDHFPLVLDLEAKDKN